MYGDVGGKTLDPFLNGTAGYDGGCTCECRDGWDLGRTTVSCIGVTVCTSVGTSVYYVRRGGWRVGKKSRTSFFQKYLAKIF
jgi:hypothetical protein